MSVRKFESAGSEARDNEPPAMSDSDWGGCVKTRKSTTGFVVRCAGRTIATMSRRQGSVGLSSAEGEFHGTASALADAKQVQEILSENHEHTHTHHCRNGLVSSQRQCRAPWLRENGTHQREIQNQEAWLRKVGTKNNDPYGLTKTGSQQVPRNMLATEN